MTDPNPPGDPTRTAGAPADIPGAGTLTDGPGAPPPAPAGGNSVPVVPGYEVRGEIARGGMGRILAARDPDLDREVAIKVLLPAKNRAAAAARFVTESKVTAKVQHPGIPPVYDLGTLPDGSPFLAMKLIRGKTLAVLLRERANPAADLPRFVAVFEQVCQAVGFAHSQGVIHRDLKPSNVMVGDFGEVQVMDWGLARAGDGRQEAGDREDADSLAATRSGAREAAHTATGAVLGTPAYMPPEQARGEAVDSRADVFALGGVLCTVLTGSSPYTGSSQAAVLARAREADLASAFEWLDACGADAELSALCKRCLSPDPNDRPADGKAVADLVAAYRAGVEERLQKAERERAAAEARAAEQRKKRRWQLALAAVVGLLLAGGGAFAWWNGQQELKAAHARGRAANLLELAAALRQEYRFAAAADALREAGELAETFAPDLLPVVDQARADLDFVVALDAVRMRRAVWTVAEGGKGRFDEAKAPAEYGREFATRGLDVTDDPDALARRLAASAVRADLVAGLNDWAMLEPDPAVRDRVLAVLKRADPNPAIAPFRDPAVWTDQAKLKALAAGADVAGMSPGTVVAVAELMRLQRLDPTRLLRRAVSLYPRDFLVAFTHAQALRKDDGERVGAYRAARAIRPDNYAVVNNLGVALRMFGDVDGSLVVLQQAIDLDDRFPQAWYNLAISLARKGKYDGAIAALRKAAEIDPKDPDVHVALGTGLRRVGRREEAIAAFRRAAELDPTDAKSRNDLGGLLRGADRVDEAILALQEAIKLDPRLAAAHANLGACRISQGDWKAAAAAFAKAVECDPKFPRAHYFLGICRNRSGDRKGAIAAFREAVKLDPADAEAHKELGVLLRAAGEAGEGYTALRGAVRLDPTSAPNQYNLGNALIDINDLDGAIAAYRAATRLDTRYTLAFYNLGNALRENGDLDNAIAAYQGAIKLDPKKATAHVNLGSIYLGQKKPGLAITHARAAVDADPKLPQARALLGFALWDAGDLVRARAELITAAELDGKRYGRLLKQLPRTPVAPPPREAKR